jgi:hypothetical protein
LGSVVPPIQIGARLSAVLYHPAAGEAAAEGDVESVERCRSKCGNATHAARLEGERFYDWARR